MKMKKNAYCRGSVVLVLVGAFLLALAGGAVSQEQE